jgi:hypothetical protein
MVYSYSDIYFSLLLEKTACSVGLGSSTRFENGALEPETGAEGGIY